MGPEISDRSSPTMLNGGTVITMDEDRRVLDPGSVVVTEDRITAVGTPEKLKGDYPDAEEIDLSHTVIMPGLVDSHGHAGHGFTKNLAEGDPANWLDTVEEIYFRASGEEFWRAESHLAALEHLEVGVTTSISFPGSMPRVDDSKYAIAAAEGYADLGLRHIVNLGPPNPPFPRQFRDPVTGVETTVDLEHALSTTAETIEQLHGTHDGRISVYVGPSSLVPEIEREGEETLTGLAGGMDLSPDEGDASELSIKQLEGVLELSDEYGVPIHTHAYAGQVQVAAEVMPEILSPQLSLAHCAGFSESEIQLLAENGVSASHGPLTHAYAMARFPLIEALDAGVNVAISTDGAAPDRSFDLLSQGRIAAQLQRAHFNDTSLLPAGKILEMMTIDAASALSLEDEIGSLEVGKKADVIALDLKSARLRPRFTLPQRIVHYGSGLDTDFMLVNGSILYKDRTFDHVPVDEILEDADEAALAAIERADATDELEPHPNTWRSVRY